jgi:hypothetical protein
MISGTGTYAIDIYDISGCWICEYNIHIKDNYRLRPNLTPGIYFARVVYNHQQQTAKFVVID